MRFAPLRGLALLALVVACDKGKREVISEASVPAASSSASATGSATVEKPPPPKTDYTSFARAEIDGNKAVGKTVLILTTRGALLTDAVKLHMCVWDKGDVQNLRATYTPAQRALVRAIPSTITRSGCTRAVVRITGPTIGNHLVAFVDAVDVQPFVPAPASSGADYGSTDDLLLAEDAAIGKVARVPIRRTSASSSNGFDAQTCDVADVVLRVDYQPSQQAFVDALPGGFSPCRAVRMKMKRLTDRHEGTWLAELVDAP